MNNEVKEELNKILLKLQSLDNSLIELKTTLDSNIAINNKTYQKDAIRNIRSEIKEIKLDIKNQMEV